MKKIVEDEKYHALIINSLEWGFWDVTTKRLFKLLSSRGFSRERIHILEGNELEGNYVILGSCGAEEVALSTLQFNFRHFSEHIFGLEKIAKRHPSSRVDLATVDYSPGSVTSKFYNPIFRALYLARIIDDKSGTSSKRSSNSPYLF